MSYVVLVHWNERESNSTRIFKKKSHFLPLLPCGPVGLCLRALRRLFAQALGEPSQLWGLISTEVLW